MNSHKNAKLTARSREELALRMQHTSAATVAAGFGVSLRTARKWKSRYERGGFEDLAEELQRRDCALYDGSPSKKGEMSTRHPALRCGVHVFEGEPHYRDSKGAHPSPEANIIFRQFQS